MMTFMIREGLHYDIIHAHFFMSGLVASILKKNFAIPYVITFHALGLVRKMHQKEADKFPEERCAIEKFVVNDADGLIAECPQDKNDLIEYYQADVKKIEIVPCGFNPDEFYPIDKQEARTFLNLPANENIFLQLGRMVPRKGIDNVIEAMGRLCQWKINNARLVIVGGDTDEPDFTPASELARLQQLAEKENISARVMFVGRKGRDLLRYYYAAADIFITTPWYEPFGITPLESMACGTPVIGSNVGGIKYSVVNGLTGFLVPPKNPRALAKQLYKIISDSAVLKSMRYHSLKRVRKHFTWLQVSKKINSFYEKVMRSQPETNRIAIRNSSLHKSAKGRWSANVYINNTVSSL
jgi:D-inositol-3-phosphate glycosyltransferase